MSSENRKSIESLESLIAEILESESRSDPVDREAIIGRHPDLAESLRDFFVNHDRMSAA